MDNIPNKDRYIAATLYVLFLISRMSIYIDTSIISAQYLNTAEFMLSGNFLIQTIQIAPIIIASIICAKRQKENIFVCLTARDVLNSFVNQVIISLVIGLVLLIIYFGIIFKNTNVGSDVFFTAVYIAFFTLHFLNIAYAIDSIIAIIFTLNGKRFKNPSIIRLIR